MRSRLFCYVICCRSTNLRPLERKPERSEGVHEASSISFKYQVWHFINIEAPTSAHAPENPVFSRRNLDARRRSPAFYDQQRSRYHGEHHESVGAPVHMLPQAAPRPLSHRRWS